MALGWLDMPTQSKNLDPYPTLYAKIKVKLITNVKVKSKAVKLSEEHILVNLVNFGLGTSFPETRPKAEMIFLKVKLGLSLGSIIL